MSRKHKETSCTKCRFFQSQEVVKCKSAPRKQALSLRDVVILKAEIEWRANGGAETVGFRVQLRLLRCQVRNKMMTYTKLKESYGCPTNGFQYHFEPRVNEIPQSPAPLRRRIESGSPRLSQHLESQTHEDHAAQGHTRWAAHHGPHTMPRYARQEA